MDGRAARGGNQARWRAMKLATFADPARLDGPRLGIARDDYMIDVVAAAQTLRRAVPATSVKAAIGGGKTTLAALSELADTALARGLTVPLERLRLLAPIPDPGKFFCVGKNSRRHREELIANDMLKEQPAEPTGFIKLVETLCGQDAEVVRPAGISTFDYEPELVFVIGLRAHGV